MFRKLTGQLEGRRSIRISSGRRLWERCRNKRQKTILLLGIRIGKAADGDRRGINGCVCICIVIFIINCYRTQRQFFLCRGNCNLLRICIISAVSGTGCRNHNRADTNNMYRAVLVDISNVRIAAGIYRCFIGISAGQFQTEIISVNLFQNIAGRNNSIV